MLQQPKRLALLLYLVLTPSGRFHRRDTLLALFWPDLDMEHARAALRRALYFLRHELGEDVVVNRAEDEVGIAAGELRCDAVEFERLLGAREHSSALELYRGDLLEGLFVAGAPEAERWLDEQRARLRQGAAQAAWALAEGEAAATAAAWARRAVALAPDDESGLRKLIALLARVGDRAGALRAYEEFAQRLKAEYDLEPDAETHKLVEALRQKGAAQGAHDPRGESATHTTRAARPEAATEPAPGLVAVMPFTVRGGAALGYLSEGMMDLLSTALDGAGDLRTVDPQVVLRAIESERSAGDDVARAAARRLGAEYLVEGSVIEAGGRVRISALLRRAATGEVASRADAPEGGEAEFFEVVDGVLREIISRIAGPGARLARIAAVTTHSFPALKAYLRGEHEMRLGRHVDACSALMEATALDPAFALAHYRLAGAYAATAMIEPAREAASHAVVHRDRLTERDRLLLDAQVAWLQGRAAEAERRYGTAVSMYPDDLEAWYLLGDLLFHSNPYRGRSVVEAKEPLERAVRLQPAHTSSLVKLARIAALTEDRAGLDSLAARALEVSPDGDQALAMRALRAFGLGRTEEQEAVRAALSGARALSVVIAFSDVALYAGDLAAADRIGRDYLALARSDELKALCHLVLAHLALAAGRVQSALGELALAEPFAPSWACEVRGLFAALPFVSLPEPSVQAVRDALEQWEPQAARSMVTYPLLLHNAIHPHLRIWLLGQLDARLGDVAACARWGEALAELPVPEGADALAQLLARSLESQERVVQGRVAEALHTLEGASVEVWYQHAVGSPFYAGTYDRFLRATLLEQAGRGSEALDWYGAIAERSPWELPFAAPAALRMAELHERSGSSAAAARCWRRAALLWKDCDPELRSVQAHAAGRADALA